MSLIDNIIAKRNLINQNDEIIVGVSGGADSLALLHYLKFSIKAQVVACHVNHNLRGDESNKDMNFVCDTCAKWNIRCVVFNENITQYARKKSISIEQAGRDIRYLRFEELRDSLGYNKIATAHTMSDNVETFTFNFTRGAGLDGLCGIPSIRENIVRPFIDLTREQIEEYCAQQKINFITDSTNLQDEYTRNKIRLNIIPQLKQINPRFEEKVGATINSLCQDRDYINRQAQEAYKQCICDGKINIELLKSYDIAIAKRIVILLLKSNNINVTYELVTKIISVAQGQSLKINVGINKYIIINSGFLSVYSQPAEIPPYFIPLQLGKMSLNNGKTYKIYIIKHSDTNNNKKIYKNLFYICLDYGRIYDKLFFRNRQEKDAINLLNRGGTKTLKKLFIENKLDNYEKSSRFVLTDGSKVVAVEGIGIDKSVAITDSTKEILVIETIF